MGRRSDLIRSRQRPPRKAGWLILAGLSPILLVGTCVGLSESNRDPGAERAALLEMRQREKDVSEILTTAGMTVDHRQGSSTVTLSTAAAMTISRREARELARATRARLGKSVRVETPAGQVLAESP